MICFKSIQYKNFLSTGDTPTRINLEAFRSSLVIGSNGSGKSTMLDALSFALFGKPHRNINKPQLLNSINQKNCEVQVEFSVGGAEYKVVRGIKPNTFEIWLNGKLMNQESHSRDYQKVLETNILKLNHKTFHQVVVLGSSSFVPFMQLSANARREVIEDLLDIGIFTKMNGLVKERNLALRGRIDGLETKVENLKSRISLQSDHIQELMGIDEQKVHEYERDVKELQSHIDALMGENSNLQEHYDRNIESVLTEMKTLKEENQKIEESKSEVRHRMKDLGKQIKMYEENSQCPTCTQSIDDVFKKVKLDELKVKAHGVQDAYDFATDTLSKISDKIEKINVVHTDLTQVKHSITANNRAIDGYQNQISKLQSKIQNNSGADVSKAQAALLADVNAKDELLNQRASEMDAKRYNEVIAEMLKDTGIKTKVIRQYLPVMNRLINSYLGVLDFFVSFQLDEAFNETIRSRHRDNFAYASFSEGEKQRIDLALLFAWRQVAKMKNSVNTNLLILDEIFDSSLDTDGVENLQKILKTLDEDTRVFVISHKKDVLEGKFERKIEFRKPNHFSQMIVSC
jgi:DNA repair exonuclease SbcCD ATPase subunit